MQAMRRSPTTVVFRALTSETQHRSQVHVLEGKRYYLGRSNWDIETVVLAVHAMATWIGKSRKVRSYRSLTLLAPLSTLYSSVVLILLLCVIEEIMDPESIAPSYSTFSYGLYMSR